MTETIGHTETQEMDWDGMPISNSPKLDNIVPPTVVDRNINIEQVLKNNKTGYKKPIFYRKPKKSEFIRVNPDPNYSKKYVIIKSDDIAYLVANSDIIKAFPNDIEYVTIRVAVNSNNTPFLVGFTFSYNGKKANSWHESLERCLTIAETKWLKIKADRVAQGYQKEISNDPKEPKFPPNTLDELILRAFEDKIIENVEHPVVKRLQGIFQENETENISLDSSGVIEEPWEPDQRAVDILNTPIEADQRYNDNVFNYFANTFTTLHSGDKATIETLLVAWALQACANTEGIQPSVSGEMGKGKTSGVYAALHLHPREYVNIGTVSPKVIFYMGNLIRPGSIFFLDDIDLKKESDLNDIMKRSMSNFQKETSHTTLTKDSDGNFCPRILKSPPRLMWIATNTKVDIGDDQLRDRMYIIPTDTDPDAEKKFELFIAEKNSMGREDYPETEEVKICRDIIKLIKTNLFRIRINDFKLEFEDNLSRRLKLQFYDFIKAVTIIRYMHRKQEVVENNIIILNSTYEDAVYAKLLFEKNIDLQKNKMSRSEIDLWKNLPLDIDGVEERDLVEAYAKTTNKTHTSSRTKIRRDLFGRDGKGGLVNKTDAVWVEKQWKPSITSSGTRNVNMIFCREHPTTNDPFSSFVRIIKNNVGENITQPLPEPS
jgi:hypothetical protein